MNRWIHILSRITPGIHTRDLAEIVAAVLLTALVCLVYRLYPAFSAKAAVRFHDSARHAHLWVVAAMLLPLMLRLALLPLVPPPEPIVHDEFSHLLVADTLAAGRLANPPHPLWRHLETIYVLQQPTYASIYPIGQGMILAIGKVLVGTPWAGLLLSVALMCGATSWMLFGCLPPAWAAGGGLAAALFYGLAPQWVNSYWGGSFCAFGGSLLLGALCRLRSSPSKRMAMIAGAGWSIVWLTRPLESLLLLIVCWALIAVFILQDSRLWQKWLGTVVLVLSIQAIAGCATALHNLAVSGSFTTLPYYLSQRTYGVPQSLLWQKPIEEPPTLWFAESKEMFLWQRKVKDSAHGSPVCQLGQNLYTAWRFYVGVFYSLPIVLLVFLLKDRQVILGGGMMLCALTASVLYPFFSPHYIAAYSCVIAFLIIKGMMTLFEWSVGGKLIGPLIVVFLVSGGVMASLRIVPSMANWHLAANSPPTTFRKQVIDRLTRFGGRHVVFVYYSADHSFHNEWVYNAANVDDAPIVWCRGIDATEDTEVTRYYKDRHFWIANVEPGMVRVSHYQPDLQPGLSTESPGGDVQDWVLRR